MRKLLIDSNILYPGLRTGKMQALKHLVEQGAVAIFVPDMVKREVISKTQSEIEASINSANSSLKTVNKKGITRGPFSGALSSIQTLLQDLESWTQQTVTEDFEAWEKEFKIEVVNFDPEKVVAVLDDYFAGDGAFQQKKNRKDIPDSIIHYTACCLRDKIGKIDFVIGDLNLRRAIASEDDINVYSDLESFYEVEGIKEVVVNFGLKPYLMSDGFNQFIISRLKENPKPFNELYLPDNIKNLEELGINAFGPELESPQVETLEKFSFLEVFDIGSDKFSATISFTALASLNYVSDYGSFLELERRTQRQVSMHSMNGDGLCDLSEPVIAEFSGEAIFWFNEPKSEADLERIVNEPKAARDELRFDFNIQEGYLRGINQ
ncbi:MULTISPECIES: PIN domain-containing protein [Idiomarina]|uniref:PIN domain-containing protein n=1 Tax=Idiomarina TaxID=135575 RepID=UPI000C0BB527|nr:MULTISPECIES: PIN domain-containing protein [Idiomarina]MAC32472.1 hypothetical protein [Haliea sp.]MAO66878.1 hypothetical protein [Idiomarina sp.]MBF81667.1 hypothetical protein [Idiomarina sp.]